MMARKSYQLIMGWRKSPFFMRERQPKPEVARFVNQLKDVFVCFSWMADIKKTNKARGFLSFL